LTPGETEQFTAIGTFSDHTTEDLTSQVTWSSSDGTLATIAANGLATGRAAGTATISATLGGVASAVRVSVAGLPTPTPTPPPLVMVTSVQLVQKKHKLTGITVVFSGAVNASEAANLATYVLTAAGKHGSFDGKGAKGIRIKSAVYDAALHQ